MRQHRVQLVELHLGSVIMRQPSGALHLGNDRVKRTVGVLRRTEIAQARVRFAGDTFEQRCREPRFADAGLAGEQHQLTFAGLRPRPAAKQKFEFFSR